MLLLSYYSHIIHYMTIGVNSVIIYTSKGEIIKSVKDLREDGFKGEPVEKETIDTMGLLRSIFEMAGKAVQSDE